MNWEHVIQMVLGALPASVAAFSSLVNGREQRRVRAELKVTNGHVRRTLQKLAKSPRKHGLQRQRPHAR